MLGAQHAQQNSDASAVIKSFNLCNLTGKWPRIYLYTIPRPYIFRQFVKYAAAAARHQ